MTIMKSPNEVIHLSQGTEANSFQTKHLVKSEQLEILRMMLPIGKELPRHTSPADIVVQCLEGRVLFSTDDRTVELVSGDLYFLAAGRPHWVKAIEDSSLLVMRPLLRSTAL